MSEPQPTLVPLFLALIAFTMVLYSIRSRHWLLVAAWLVAFVRSASFAAGIPLSIFEVLGVPLYCLWAWHTLDVTKIRHPDRWSGPARPPQG